jgi:hypothetical protein
MFSPNCSVSSDSSSLICAALLLLFVQIGAAADENRDSLLQQATLFVGQLERIALLISVLMPAEQLFIQQDVVAVLDISGATCLAIASAVHLCWPNSD